MHCFCRWGHFCKKGHFFVKPLNVEAIGLNIKIKQGLETPVAKEVTGFIRDTKLKVTTQIQEQKVRVTGKSRDDLQAVIGAVRAKEFPVELQFVNFRD